MSRAIVLLVDNDEHFLEMERRKLQGDGYKVIPATSPDEARQVLDKGSVDIAIIDIRLLNDRDENDWSGIELANSIAPSIPKLIFTAYPSTEAAREALRVKFDGLPPATDFLAKAEGHDALVTSIQRVLRIESPFRKLSINIALKIEDDYLDARRQAKWNFHVSLVVSILGVLIILFGAATALKGILAVGTISAVAGLVAEAIALLFFRRADAANERTDRYHHELLEIRFLEILLAASDELGDQELAEKSKTHIIGAATLTWFMGGRMPTQSTADLGEKGSQRGK